MYDRMQTLSREALNRIHDASMEILKGTGIAFNEPQALSLFKSRGFKVENNIVFFDKKQIRTALDHTPSRFVLHARNPKHNVAIEENDFVFVRAYGAPFIAMPD